MALRKETEEDRSYAETQLIKYRVRYYGAVMGYRLNAIAKYQNTYPCHKYYFKWCELDTQ